MTGRLFGRCQEHNLLASRETASIHQRSRSLSESVPLLSAVISVTTSGRHLLEEGAARGLQRPLQYSQNNSLAHFELMSRYRQI